MHLSLVFMIIQTHELSTHLDVTLVWKHRGDVEKLTKLNKTTLKIIISPELSQSYLPPGMVVVTVVVVGVVIFVVVVVVVEPAVEVGVTEGTDGKAFGGVPKAQKQFSLFSCLSKWTYWMESICLCTLLLN